MVLCSQDIAECLHSSFTDLYYLKETPWVVDTGSLGLHIRDYLTKSGTPRLSKVDSKSLDLPITSEEFTALRCMKT